MKQTKTTETKTETKTPTVQQYLDKLDKFVDLPQNEQNSNAYLDTMFSFYLNHPDEAAPILRMILPKVKTISNSSARVLSQICAEAFPEASFPYIPLADNNRVPAQAVRDWFSGTVFPAAALAWMKRQYGRLVYLGLWSHMRNQDDLCQGSTLSEEVESCSRLVWTWASQNVHSLMRDRSNKPSRIGSRLKAFAGSNIARTWKTLSLRAKQKQPPIIAVDDIEQPPAKGTRSVVLGGTPVEQQTPKTTALYCVPCAGVKTVVSEAEDVLQLACGHSRSTISPETIRTK